MLGTPFAHDMIRKYVVAFGTLFSDIKLHRVTDTDTQWISVPLSYAPKEKWYARLTGDPELAKQVALSLPQLSYELVTATYAPDRKLNTMNRHVRQSSDKANYQSMYGPVPYDFSFSLYLYCRNAADASNIIEQILPFFTPEFTVTINNATDLGVNIDLPIVLNGISREDAYEGDFESHRTIIWTMEFTLKGLLFGPVRDAKLIKKAYVDFFIPDLSTGYHKGTLAKDSVIDTELYLQTNTSSRTSNSYDSAFITITGEGAGTTGITGNTRSIIFYDGSTQRAVVSEKFDDIPLDTWTYTVQYRKSRSDTIEADQLLGVPTATRIYTQPGVTTDGDPTSDINLSVPVSEIDATDDYGIIQIYTFFPDDPVKAGTRRNLKTGDDE